jgi:hypothetical protein
MEAAPTSSARGSRETRRAKHCRSALPARAFGVLLLTVTVCGQAAQAAASAPATTTPATTSPASSAQGTTATSASAEVVRKTEDIPRDHYDTWCLFLVCNQEWLAPEKSEDLYRLYEDFERFGRTIGDNNLAVWFWKKGMRHIDQDLAENVDVERSIRFCKAFKLKPSSGPHILVLSSYPKVKRLPKDYAYYAYYALGGMSPRAISALLGKIADELVMEGRVPAAKGPVADPGAVAARPPAAALSTAAAAAATTKPGPLWVRLLAATQASIRSFGCAWSFKVKAGVVETDLRPCEKAK